jgi:osmoprotectant transport system permease protein
VPQRFPAAWAALQQLAGRVDEEAMIAMNARAELQGVAFDAIRARLLAGTQGPAGTGARGFWAKLFRTRPVAAGLATPGTGGGLGGLLPRWWRFRWRWPASPGRGNAPLLLGVTGLLQTVPSLALLAILISLLGAIGVVPALLALTLYALLPIMRNTRDGPGRSAAGPARCRHCAGHDGAPAHAPDRTSVGLAHGDRGVRIATTIAIGTATIAAFIGAGGFGERIVTGLALNDSGLLLAGRIPARGPGPAERGGVRSGRARPQPKPRPCRAMPCPAFDRKFALARKVVASRAGTAPAFKRTSSQQHRLSWPHRHQPPCPYGP